MKAAPVGFQALLARMPRWFVEHARKTEVRGRRRRAALAARFELAFAPPARSAAGVRPEAPVAWPDTVAAWSPHGLGAPR